MQSWLELDLLSGFYGLFVQSVSQPLHHADHVYLPVGGEQYFEAHFSVDLLLSSFVRVIGLGLEGDLDRSVGSVIRLLRPCFRMDAGESVNRAVAKSRACNHARVCDSDPVASTRSTG